MQIDRYLPPSDTVVFRAAVVGAGVEQTYGALRRFDFFQVPIVRIPNLMRLWPERLWRGLRGREPPARAPQRVTFDDLVAMRAFEVLVEEPGCELVLGSVGRFWTRDFGAVPFTRETFTGLSPPDCGKIAWSIRVEPYGERRSLVVIDVRVGTTDAVARAHFRRYWRPVGPVVRLMTRSWLGQVQKGLERMAVPDEASGPALLLERQLPSFDVVDLFAREVRADAGPTYAASRRVEQLMLRDPLIRLLGALRNAPGWLAARLGLRARRPAPAQRAPTPFVLLGEQPEGEYVVGLIGRFWEAGIGILPVAPEGFRTFNQPGYAKVALSYVVRQLSPGRSLLISEVRTALTDARARRRFERYWTWLDPFARLVMWRQLALIKREAEHGPEAITRPAMPLPPTVPGLFPRPSKPIPSLT